MVRDLLQSFGMSVRNTGTVLILFAVTAVMGCAADASPEDDVSEVEGTEDALLGGTKLTASEVADVVREAGFPASVVGKMVCTAKWESSFFDGATNRNKNRSMDRGLFQINDIHLGDAGCPTKAHAETLFDPATNAKCALAVFRSQGATAWYGYRAHKRECDSFVAPKP